MLNVVLAWPQRSYLNKAFSAEPNVRRWPQIPALVGADPHGQGPAAAQFPVKLQPDSVHLPPCVGESSFNTSGAGWLRGRWSCSSSRPPQVFGVTDDGAVVGMIDGPLPGLFTELMNIIAGLVCQLVFDPPEFLKDWIRFHEENLPLTQSGCKPWANAIRAPGLPCPIV